MNFRSRLTLFFVLLVLVPIGSVGFVLYRVLSDRQAGRDDARLAEARVAATSAYGDAVAAARAALPALRGDGPLLAALRAGDGRRATVLATTLQSRAGLTRLLASAGGRSLVNVGDPGAVAPFTARLTGTGGSTVAEVDVSRTTATALGRHIHALTGLDVVLRNGAAPLTTPFPRLPGSTLPTTGSLDIAGRGYRVATAPVAGFPGQDLRLSLLADQRDTRENISSIGLLAGGLLVGFILLALVFTLTISRSLQAQVGRFLAAARRVASGDFSQPVPSEGHDEFAALGVEFNKMSEQLERRVAQLQAERQRLEEMIRRTGEAFGATLDRGGLLAIGLRTAVEGVEAEGGRASVRSRTDHRGRERARAGSLGGAEHVLGEAEHQAQSSGLPAEVTVEDRHALAFALAAADDGQSQGVLSVHRRQRPFTRTERELFHYLGQQTARSIENVTLHERVRVQAVTDELTGLSNHRRFQESLASEVGRARRFEQPLGLVMLDIDNFKRVNDTYGHQQGDQVLREVARVLRETARDIDEPARYGGEELAVALPQTDLDGAYFLAERVREAIESLQIPILDGEGAVGVTASFGVAAVPDSAISKQRLVAVADEALYRAKRGGKNRTERARAAGAGATPAG